MYNIRKLSLTHGKSNKKQKILFDYNHLLYLKKLENYIKDFRKERKYLYFELIEINKLLLMGFLKNVKKNYFNFIMEFCMINFLLQTLRII